MLGTLKFPMLNSWFQGSMVCLQSKPIVGSFLELHAAGKNQIAPSISHSHSLEGDTPIAVF